MSPRKRKLGPWQISMMTKIAANEVCCHRSVIDILRGSAKTWDRKYKKSLAAGISAHNLGLATNSPVDPYLKIEEDPLRGFRLVPKI